MGPQNQQTIVNKVDRRARTLSQVISTSLTGVAASEKVDAVRYPAKLREGLLALDSTLWALNVEIGAMRRRLPLAVCLANLDGLQLVPVGLVEVVYGESQ